MWFRFKNNKGLDAYVNLSQCSVVRFEGDTALIWEAGIAATDQGAMRVRDAGDIQRLRVALEGLTC